MVKDETNWVDKQIRNAGNATEDFRAGVENVTDNPAKKALAKNQKRINGLQKSFTDKSWENSMSKVSLEDWKGATLAKADRFGDGVSKARPKIERFVRGFRPKLVEISNAVQAMPDDTEAQRDARMMENAKRMRKAKGTWR